MKISYLFIVLLFWDCISCQSIEEDPIEEVFYGKWKLTKRQSSEAWRTEEMSVYNIVHEYEPGGILTISGDSFPNDYYRGENSRYCFFIKKQEYFDKQVKRYYHGGISFNDDCSANVYQLFFGISCHSDSIEMIIDANNLLWSSYFYHYFTKIK